MVKDHLGPDSLFSPFPAVLTYHCVLWYLGELITLFLQNGEYCVIDKIHKLVALSKKENIVASTKILIVQISCTMF